MRSVHLLAALALVLAATEVRAAWILGYGGEDQGGYAMEQSDNTAAGRDCTIVTTPTITGTGAISCTNDVGSTEVQETDSWLPFNETDGDGAAVDYPEAACCFDFRTTEGFWAREAIEVETPTQSAAVTRVRSHAGWLQFTTNSTANNHTDACGIANDTWLRVCFEADNNTGTGDDHIRVWCNEVPDASAALDVTMSGGAAEDAAGLDLKATLNTTQGTHYIEDLVCISELVSTDSLRAGKLYAAEVRSLIPDTAKLTPTDGMDVQDAANVCANCDTASDVAQCVGSDTSGDCERIANCLGGGASGACGDDPSDSGEHAILMGTDEDYVLTGYPAADSALSAHDIYAVGIRYRASNNNTADNTYRKVSTDSGCHSNSTCTPVGTTTMVLDAATTYETVTAYHETDPDNGGSWTKAKLDDLAAGIHKHTGAGNLRIEAHDVTIISSDPVSSTGKREFFVDVSRRAPEGALWQAIARAPERGAWSVLF